MIVNYLHFFNSVYLYISLTRHVKIYSLIRVLKKSSRMTPRVVFFFFTNHCRGGVEVSRAFASHAGYRGSIPGRDRPKS